MSNGVLTDKHQKHEASLVDAWRALVERKKMVFFIWVLISLVGVVAAVVMPQKYAFTTLVEVGSHGKDLVETAAAARARLIAHSIHVIKKKYLDEGKSAFDIDVELIVKSPSMLMLESRGTAQSVQDHFALHKDILDALRREHQSISSKVYAGLVEQQEKTKLGLAMLQDERVLLGEQRKRLDERQTYLNARAIPSNTDSALVQIMLISLEETKRVEVKKAITNNMRDMDQRRIELSQISGQIEGIRETTVALPFAQSKNPVAPNRSLIIILAIFAGLVMGVLGVFLMESFLKVREEG